MFIPQIILLSGRQVAVLQKPYHKPQPVTQLQASPLITKIATSAKTKFN
jgi:hypothetical protein